MKATYEDFIADNPNCSSYEKNADAEQIFDFLNEDANIIKMIDYVEFGKPALAGCICELEQMYDNMQRPSIDLNKRFDRELVGRMIKTVLEPFGYVVTIQKSLPKNLMGKYFTSASCYALLGIPRMQVFKMVTEVEKYK